MAQILQDLGDRYLVLNPSFNNQAREITALQSGTDLQGNKKNLHTGDPGTSPTNTLNGYYRGDEGIYYNGKVVAQLTPADQSIYIPKAAMSADQIQSASTIGDLLSAQKAEEEARGNRVIQQNRDAELAKSQPAPVQSPPQAAPVSQPPPMLPNINLSAPVKSGYQGTSIVDYLKSVGQPSDYSSRSALAQRLGIKGYTGTADQNTSLLNSLRSQASPQQSSSPQQTSAISPAGTQTATGGNISQAYTPDQSVQSPQAPSSSSASSTTSYSTGNDVLDQTLGALEKYVTKLTSSGYQLNPNVKINPEMVKQFLDQAHTEIDPYYKGQISSIRSDLDRNLSDLSTLYNFQRKDAESNFKSSLGILNEKEAGSGTTFSGGAGRRQGELVDSTNRNLDQLAFNANRSAQAAGTTAQRQVGDLSGFNSPSLTNYGADVSGTGSLTPRSVSSLYNPVSGMSGSLQREQTTAERTRATQLEQDERQRRALNFYA